MEHGSKQASISKPVIPSWPVLPPMHGLDGAPHLLLRRPLMRRTLEIPLLTCGEPTPSAFLSCFTALPPPMAPAASSASNLRNLLLQLGQISEARPVWLNAAQ